MQFIIDTDKLNSLGEEADVLLYLVSLYLKHPITEDTPIKAHNKGYTLKQSSSFFTPYTIEREGIFKVEQLFLNSEIKNNKEGESFEEIADAMRELYPKGLKPGTSYQWKDSTSIIAQRLKALVKKYNVTFTKEEAIDATKRYVASFNGNFRYMQILKYFISKQVTVGSSAEQNSQFLSFLQNKEETTDITSQDWTANLV